MNKKLAFLLSILLVSPSSSSACPNMDSNDQDSPLKNPALPIETSLAPPDEKSAHLIMANFFSDPNFLISFLKNNPEAVQNLGNVYKVIEQDQNLKKQEEEDKIYQRARRFHNTMLATLSEPKSRFINVEWEPDSSHSSLSYTPVYGSSYSGTELDNETDFDNPLFVSMKGEQLHQETLRDVTQDKRYPVNHPYRWPYSICGKLLTHFEKKKDIIGTGTLISPIHVLTAGHCILDRVNRYGLATSISFIYPVACPNEEAPSSTEWKQIRAKEAYVVTGWSKEGRPECDYGVIVLNEPINNLHVLPGNQAPSNGIFASLFPKVEKEDLGRFQLLAKNNFEGNWVNIAGFPLKHGPCEEGKEAKEVNTSEVHHIYTAYGKLILNSKSSELLSHEVDTTAGQSGSLVYSVELKNDRSHYSGIGIHTQGFDHKETTRNKDSLINNKAVMFTPVHLTNIRRWSSSGEGQPN